MTCVTFGIGYNGAETNCGIAHILGILLTNNYDLFKISQATTVFSLKSLKNKIRYQRADSTNLETYCLRQMWKTATTLNDKTSEFFSLFRLFRNTVNIFT